MKRQILITVLGIAALIVLTYAVCTLPLPIGMQVAFGLLGGLIIGGSIMLVLTQ